MLPFENTARDTASDLVHHASVTLLYQEMSRWQDVRVISDARVADLLRELPAAERARIGLAAASGLARRAGAAHVVVGTYLAVRGRASVTATVYDVRTGREVRVVRDAVSGLAGDAAVESLSTTFARIARNVLAIPSAPSIGAPGAGTTSIEAYRYYVAAVSAINRLAQDSARLLLDRSLALDSNFAMARFRAWQAARDTMEGRRHRLAAIRLADGLPPLERLVVQGYAADQRRDIVELCRLATALTSADSTVADGWVLTARCHSERRIVREGGTVRIAGDPTRALRAAVRAWSLAPGSFDAFGTWVNVALGALGGGNNTSEPYRMICADPLPQSEECAPPRLMRFVVIPGPGDSIELVAEPWASARRAPRDRTPAAVAAWQRHLTHLHDGLTRYDQPINSWLLGWIAGVVATAMGDTTSAKRWFGRADDSLPAPARQAAAMTLELARGRVPEARAYADSAFAAGRLASQHRTLFGHYAESRVAATGDSAAAVAVWRQVFSGVLPAGFDSVEAAVAGRLAGWTRDDMLQLSTLAAFYLRRRGPALDTAAAHPVKRAQARLARGDSAAARAALAEFDRELTERHVATADDGGWLFAAELHLLLLDSAAALRTLQDFARRWVFIVSRTGGIVEQWYYGSAVARLWPRTWMLLGDVAMARGQAADARRAYRMVMGFWEQGDPVVQPAVARARAALARLGN